MNTQTVNLKIVLNRGDTIPGLRQIGNESAAISQRVSRAQVQANNEITRSYERLQIDVVAGARRTAQAREMLGIRSENIIRSEINRTREAYEQLARSGAFNARELARAQDAMVRKVKELNAELRTGNSLQEKANNLVTTAAALSAGGYVAKRIIGAPLASYETLEAAKADLRIAMMDKTGVEPANYQSVMRQTVKLGNELPGSAKDFTGAAIALKQQGMPDSAVLNGGLRSAAYFSVLNDMDPYRAAQTIAKTREAYGLKDKELPQTADLMQRARFGFGIAPEDFMAVASYAAPTYRELGLTGIKNTKELFAIQGIAAQQGLENTSFGTNFSMMLARTAQFDGRLNKNSKEAREIKKMLDGYGIDMNFFNKQGEFGGVRNAISQFEKLKPLSDQDRIKVLTKLFGVEAARPASILVDSGVKGFDKALQLIDSQASLEQRIKVKTSTLQSRKDAASGNIDNAMASVGESVSAPAKAFYDKVGEYASRAQPFLERNPKTAAAGLVTTAAAGGGLTTLAASSLADRFLATETGAALANVFPFLRPAASVMSKTAGAVRTAGAYAGAVPGMAGLELTSMMPVMATMNGINNTFMGGNLNVSDLIERFIVPAIKEQPPAEVKTTVEVKLSDGLKAVSQTSQSFGPVKAFFETGSVWGQP
ncbi:phage tail tape measure protein [Methylophilus sp. DW102]|uniref:phage tail tape measure protein n=1 Tax=Methylophilus sp. DW102 TaxID=3095607 RepID=UPI0030934D02|nr:hypothetical protein MTDW_26130 [Methylophilus sp. DW102]